MLDFLNLVSALPDGAETCLYCGRRSRDLLAMVLAADESDDSPLTLYTVICSKCSTLHPTDQLLIDWAEKVAERRCPGDKVQWQDFVGVYLRDAADDQAEIDIAWLGLPSTAVDFDARPATITAPSSAYGRIVCRCSTKSGGDRAAPER